MRVGFLTFGCDGGRSGIGRYAIELLREWCRPHYDITVEVVGFSGDRTIFLPSQATAAPLWLNIDPYYATPLRNIVWHQLKLPRLARRRAWDVLFFPAGNRRLAVWAPCPTVGVVHDFSALHVPGKYDRARMFYIRHVLPCLMRRLTRIITISESSRRDILEYAHYPAERLSIVPHAVDQTVWYPRNRPDALARLQRLAPLQTLQAGCILYISRIEHPGKNHVTLIEAVAELRRRTGVTRQLVLVGGDWDRAAEVHAAAERSPIKNDILWTGFLPSSELPDLMATADLFVFPSLYEGFGMPILEAMAAGVPVVCANVSSLPEVAGSAAVLYEPAQDVSALADAMQKVLSDRSLAADLRRRGRERADTYRWSDTAERTLEVLRAAVEKQ